LPRNAVPASISAKTADGPALSNPAGLINLGQDRCARIGSPRVRLAGICALAAGPRRTHILNVDSAAGSGRPEAAIRKSTWELSDGSARRTSPGRCPVFCGDLERLCHVANNFQI
jgi:hypothetical protein